MPPTFLKLTFPKSVTHDAQKLSLVLRGRNAINTVIRQSAGIIKCRVGFMNMHRLAQNTAIKVHFHRFKSQHSVVVTVN